MNPWGVVVGDSCKAVASPLPGLPVQVCVAARRVTHRGFLQR